MMKGGMWDKLTALRCHLSTSALLLVIALSKVSTAGQHDLRTGLLVSYSNHLELLDPATGEVWLKTSGLTDGGGSGGDVTNFAVAAAEADRLTVLAVEMVN